MEMIKEILMFCFWWIYLPSGIITLLAILFADYQAKTPKAAPPETRENDWWLKIFLVAVVLFICLCPLFNTIIAIGAITSKFNFKGDKSSATAVN